jgi:signal transduction histidine kinase/DNA-binding response OmpR family regulator
MRNYIYFIYWLTFFLPGYGKGQNLIDSLRSVYFQSKSDSAYWYNSCLLGAVYFRSNLDSGLHYSKVSLDYATKTGVPRMVASSELTIGAMYQYKDEPETAIEWYLKAYETSKKGNQKNTEATALGNIGLLYAETHVPEKALYYLKLSLQQFLENKDTSGITRSYANIGFNYFEQDQLDSAMFYFQKELEWARLAKEKSTEGAALNNIGSVYLERNEPSKARSYLLDALKIREEMEDKQGMVNVLDNLGEAYLKENAPQKAVDFYERSTELAREIGGFSIKINPLTHLSKAYSRLGDFKKAYELQQELLIAKDSVNQTERQERTDQLEAKFRNQFQAAQLAQKELEIERKSNQNRTILIGAVAALLALAGGFQYFRSKQKIRQKEAELVAQLRQAEAEKLREMDAMKTAFFANVSHEFRTPLTLIISPLKKLLNNPAERPNPSLYRTMLLSGERLLELVNQLLDLTKAEAGKLELQPVEADVLPVLRGVAGSFTSLADVRHIRFETAMPTAELPARFDKDKLSKILSNLLSNAFKFTPEEGTVRVVVNTEGENLLLEVSDTGTGIEADELPHVFERFYRAKEARRGEVAGSGIGLALTKELVELHGGNIRIASQFGQGTAFKVQLPVLKNTSETNAELAEEVLTGAVFPDQAPNQSLKKMASPGSNAPHILIVEDNPDVRRFIEDCLAENYLIQLAPDGQAGLETARKSIPDLIISDVMMPKMDGFELCRELKTDDRTSHIPVVMLTARAESSDKLTGLSTGADDYLIKPFDARELQARVANLIAQRKKLQEHYRRTLAFATSAPVEAESIDMVFLKRVREAVESNMEDENFSVVELGLQVGMSRSQLHRKLSALTGFSPNEIIRNMRLERAKELLEKKAGNASEIAYMTGFNSPAYFAKCFKDYFGKTPSEV